MEEGNLDEGYTTRLFETSLASYQTTRLDVPE